MIAKVYLIFVLACIFLATPCMTRTTKNQTTGALYNPAYPCGTPCIPCKKDVTIIEDDSQGMYVSHWLMFFPNDIFSYDIFSQDNFSYWHFFLETFFPKTFFPMQHFFLVTFFPCDIFSQVLFFPKWHFFLIFGYFFLFIFPKNFMRKVVWFGKLFSPVNLPEI